ncbi:hypothetical protein BDB00DRAFT_929189 [Zychaea mexicana]|uniref:uncharacterized protein n=1 Tax=Zychaea mexicana TaxID=64656 RepID=UPI0022FE9B0F|nr:uncharacterized protein BDB00DRAFT_929189 [Zychaea mexicana]KAI9493125.1 hypothetical protein BDB00DRAFT_929189 [Zychaea mexicana]
MSLFEALYAGKRTVIRPFCGDHPANVLHFDREQLGGYLDMDRKENVFEPLLWVIQSNVDRHKQLAQIHAQHAVVRGADLGEEALFTSKDGYLQHRRDIAKRLNFLKAYDYDFDSMLNK